MPLVWAHAEHVKLLRSLDGTQLSNNNDKTVSSRMTAEEPTRRDFLCIANGAMGDGPCRCVGAHLGDQRPRRETGAHSVGISNIAKGQVVTVKWRGKPVFISHFDEDLTAASRPLYVEHLVVRENVVYVRALVEGIIRGPSGILLPNDVFVAAIFRRASTRRNRWRR
jgi:hypothetical protein